MDFSYKESGLRNPRAKVNLSRLLSHNKGGNTGDANVSVDKSANPALSKGGFDRLLVASPAKSRPRKKPLPLTPPRHKIKSPSGISGGTLSAGKKSGTANNESGGGGGSSMENSRENLDTRFEKEEGVAEVARQEALWRGVEAAYSDDTIACFHLPVPGTASMHRFKYEVLIESEPAPVVAIARELDLMPSWHKFVMPNASIVEKIDSCEQTGSFGGIWGYVELWFPWPLANRAMVVKCEVVDVLAEAGAILVRLLSGEYPDPSKLPTTPEQCPRLHAQNLTQIIPLPCKADGTPLTKFVLFVDADFMGAHIPAFIIQFILKVMSPLVYGKTKELLEKMSLEKEGGGGVVCAEGALFRERMKLLPEMYSSIEERTKEHLAKLLAAKAAAAANADGEGVKASGCDYSEGEGTSTTDDAVSDDDDDDDYVLVGYRRQGQHTDGGKGGDGRVGSGGCFQPYGGGGRRLSHVRSAGILDDLLEFGTPERPSPESALRTLSPHRQRREQWGRLAPQTPPPLPPPSPLSPSWLPALPSSSSSSSHHPTGNLGGVGEGPHHEVVSEDAARSPQQRPRHHSRSLGRRESMKRTQSATSLRLMLDPPARSVCWEWPGRSGGGAGTATSSSSDWSSSPFSSSLTSSSSVSARKRSALQSLAAHATRSEQPVRISAAVDRVARPYQLDYFPDSPSSSTSQQSKRLRPLAKPQSKQRKTAHVPLLHSTSTS